MAMKVKGWVRDIIARQRGGIRSLQASGNPRRLLSPCRRRKSSTTSFPVGAKVLHGCPDAKADVCFVHGFMGNRETKWTADGEAAP